MQSDRRDKRMHCPLSRWCAHLRFTDTSSIDSVEATLTSAQNAYGVITRNFFDGGSVVHHPLMKGSFRIFRVTDIREIINPAYSGCSEQSYYECLELSLANMDVCTEHGGICEYISMPQSILPVCKSGMSFEQ